jgi:Cu(I)/Ag(I) efflux system periplasmic protein CusF
MSHSRRHVLAGVLIALIVPAMVRAQSMSQTPGMGGAKTVSDTGTITAINTADRRITLDQGPIPEIKWPAMKLESPVASSVDLSKVKVGDKVQFTITGGSGVVYTVQSISPNP